MSKLRCMDLTPIFIDAEMVAKLYRLACGTMGEPSNDDCEEIATNLLDAALNAALEKCDGMVGTIDLHKVGVKLELVAPLPAKPKARKGGSKR